MAFSALLASWNSISASFSSCESTFCLHSHWREGAPSWHCCCIFSHNCSTSFLISRPSDAVWRMDLCTGHFALPSSLLDG
jgi:hypothetical protein